jgi:hypothetical protein
MTDEYQSTAIVAEPMQETHALLEESITHRQGLIHNEHVCIDVSNDREPQAREHATEYVFTGRSM